MANFAVLEGNVVVNVIIAENINDAQEVTGKVCVEYTDENPGAIGWTYDENSNIFIMPPKEDISVEE